MSLLDKSVKLRSAAGTAETPKSSPKVDSEGGAGYTFRPLSLSSTRSHFSVWLIRFRSLVGAESAHPSLLPAILSSDSRDKDLTKDAINALASLLVRSLADDVLEEFMRHTDVFSCPLLYLQQLQSHFDSLATTEESPEELLLSTLRSRRNRFSSLSAFIAHVKLSYTSISSLGSPTKDRLLFIEKLLALHILSSLGHQAHWLHSITTSTRTKIRDPSKANPFSLNDFCRELLEHCPFDPDLPLLFSSLPSSSASHPPSSQPPSSAVHKKKPVVNTIALFHPQADRRMRGEAESEGEEIPNFEA
jgi:hypothetical protein